MGRGRLIRGTICRLVPLLKSNISNINDKNDFKRAVGPVSVSSVLASFPAAASTVLPPDSNSLLSTHTHTSVQ